MASKVSTNSASKRTQNTHTTHMHTRSHVHLLLLKEIFYNHYQPEKKCIKFIEIRYHQQYTLNDYNNNFIYLAYTDGSLHLNCFPTFLPKNCSGLRLQLFT